MFRNRFIFCSRLRFRSRCRFNLYNLLSRFWFWFNFDLTGFYRLLGPDFNCRCFDFFYFCFCLSRFCLRLSCLGFCCFCLNFCFICFRLCCLNFRIGCRRFRLGCVCFRLGGHRFHFLYFRFCGDFGFLWLGLNRILLQHSLFRRFEIFIIH